MYTHTYIHILTQNIRSHPHHVHQLSFLKRLLSTVKVKCQKQSIHVHTHIHTYTKHSQSSASRPSTFLSQTAPVNRQGQMSETIRPIYESLDLADGNTAAMFKGGISIGLDMYVCVYIYVCWYVSMHACQYLSLEIWLMKILQ